MIHDGRVIGLPLVNYTNTKAAIEALSLTAADVGATAWATDTEQVGIYDGVGWVWYSPADMLKSVYDTDNDGVVNAADYATTTGDADTVDGEHASAFEAAGTAAAAIGVHAALPDVHHAAVTLKAGHDAALSLSGQELDLADVLTPTEHTAIGDAAPHHAAVTLDANADTLLSLSTQQLGLDTQVANRVMAGPASGAAAVPTFRALVAADLPAATEAAQGAAELATTAEVQTGTDTTRIVTPAGLRADVPATPTASRGVRLDANGDLLLPSGGDVLPDGATDVDHGVDKRLRDVSGPVGVGDYGYNPAQLIAPVNSWYLGVADDGTCRDDFFRDNYAGAGAAIWTATTGCTPYLVQIPSSDRPSWMTMQSKSTRDASPSHAIIQASITSHSSSHYWSRLAFVALSSDRARRAGLVLMQSDLLYGAAFWLVWDNATEVMTLVAATYDSANAWLSQAGATDSNVAYTTDWTTRATSADIPGPFVGEYALAIRAASTQIQWWMAQNLAKNSYRLGFVTKTFTPAYLYIFLEGNLAERSQVYCDFTGRGAI